MYFRITGYRKFSKFCFFRGDQKIMCGFYSGGLWENICEYSWLKNNATQLYSTLGTAELCWNFFPVP